ncbi:MAG: hypothetical protein WBK87_05600 [Limnochordia bacterium]
MLMNAAAALYVGKKAADLEEGLQYAAEIIDSGAAYETLCKWIEVSRELQVS